MRRRDILRLWSQIVHHSGIEQYTSDEWQKYYEDFWKCMQSSEEPYIHIDNIDHLFHNEAFISEPSSTERSRNPKRKAPQENVKGSPEDEEAEPVSKLRNCIHPDTVENNGDSNEYIPKRITRSSQSTSTKRTTQVTKSLNLIETTTLEKSNNSIEQHSGKKITKEKNALKEESLVVNLTISSPEQKSNPCHLLCSTSTTASSEANRSKSKKHPHNQNRQKNIPKLSDEPEITKSEVKRTEKLKPLVDASRRKRSVNNNSDQLRTLLEQDVIPEEMPLKLKRIDNDEQKQPSQQQGNKYIERQNTIQECLKFKRISNIVHEDQDQVDMMPTPIDLTCKVRVPSTQSAVEVKLNSGQDGKRDIVFHKDRNSSITTLSVKDNDLNEDYTHIGQFFDYELDTLNFATPLERQQDSSLSLTVQSMGSKKNSMSKLNHDVRNIGGFKNVSNPLTVMDQPPLELLTNVESDFDFDDRNFSANNIQDIVDNNNNDDNRNSFENAFVDADSNADDDADIISVWDCDEISFAEKVLESQEELPNCKEHRDQSNRQQKGVPRFNKTTDPGHINGVIEQISHLPLPKLRIPKIKRSPPQQQQSPQEFEPRSMQQSNQMLTDQRQRPEFNIRQQNADGYPNRTPYMAHNEITNPAQQQQSPQEFEPHSMQQSNQMLTAQRQRPELNIRQQEADGYPNRSTNMAHNEITNLGYTSTAMDAPISAQLTRMRTLSNPSPIALAPAQLFGPGMYAKPECLGVIFGIKCWRMLDGSCTQHKCNHALNGMNFVKYRLKMLKKSELSYIYSQVLRHGVLFKNYALLFVEIFGDLSMKSHLMRMVEDCELYMAYSGPILLDLFNQMLRVNINSDAATARFMKHMWKNNIGRQYPMVATQLLRILADSDWFNYIPKLEHLFFVQSFHIPMEFMESITLNAISSKNQMLIKKIMDLAFRCPINNNNNNIVLRNAFKKIQEFNDSNAALNMPYHQ